MPQRYLSEHPTIGVDGRSTLSEFANLVYDGVPDLHNIAKETLRMVGSTLSASTDEQMAEYTSRGRGAEFTAVNLFKHVGHDDVLRLHLYPEETEDGEYHRHERRIISTVTHGALLNDTAEVILCEPGDDNLDVWDCTKVDNICIPTKSDEVGARFRPIAINTIEAGDTYGVHTAIYHRVVVEAGTLTLCWFARSAMQEDEALIEGRIIKPPNIELAPIPQLVAGDMRDLRSALR